MAIRERLLIVDDESASRALLRAALERRGFDVADAPGGAEALAMIEAQRPHAVLLDALMPEMDGFEVCRRIRALPSGDDIPVLMLTSLDADDAIGLAYEAGATDFVLKSAQMTLLAQRIRYMLRAHRTQRELARSREKLARSQRIARLGGWEWNLAAGTVHCSEECLRLLDLDPVQSEVPQDSFCAHLQSDGVSGSLSAAIVLEALRAEGSFRKDYTVVTRNAGPRRVQFECEADTGDGNGIHRVHGTVQDVTERHMAEEQVRRLANFDTLTALPNRAYFRERLDRALAGAGARGRVALLFIDLDRFKRVNDTLGHLAGDALLREVADRLTRSVRRGESDSDADDCVARLGGDEFVVLLSTLARREDAVATAERLLAALREPFDLLGHEFWVSASVGIACYPEDGADAETLLLRADTAMYRVKQNGRDAHALYVPQHEVNELDRFRLESNLRKAIERDELRLFYQPIVDVRQGRVVGAEALMRWQRGDTLVSPAQFIPIAEESGLIVPMGEWALEAACRMAKQWGESGLDQIYVAVNIPGNHFQKRDLRASVKRVLDASGLASDRLQIEITESTAMQAVEHTLRTLRDLKELGIRFSVDDFGTGYSSLAYLKRLPIDTLKIDRSFVKDVTIDNEDEVIVTAIIGLARSLNLGVVAEGVETVAQRDFLSLFGNTLMQGYLFAKPLSAGEFEGLLAQTSGARRRVDWIAPERGVLLDMFDPARRGERASPMLTRAAG